MQETEPAPAAAPHPESVMEGDGYYNRNSRPQHVVGDVALPLLHLANAALQDLVAAGLLREADYR